jgi:hypothetical protein
MTSPPSKATFYKGNDDEDDDYDNNNNKPNKRKNRGDTIFAITVISAAILVTLKILFLSAWPW